MIFFLFLGVVECHSRAMEISAGILPVLIKKKLIKSIAKIIMGMNILAGLLLGPALAEPMDKAKKHSRYPDWSWHRLGYSRIKKGMQQIIDIPPRKS